MAEWNIPHYAALAMKHNPCASRRFRLADTLRVLWAAKPPAEPDIYSYFFFSSCWSASILLLRCSCLHLRRRAAVSPISVFARLLSGRFVDVMVVSREVVPPADEVGLNGGRTGSWRRPAATVAAGAATAATERGYWPRRPPRRPCFAGPAAAGRPRPACCTPRSRPRARRTTDRRRLQDAAGIL